MVRGRDIIRVNTSECAANEGCYDAPQGEKVKDKRTNMARGKLGKGYECGKDLAERCLARGRGSSLGFASEWSTLSDFIKLNCGCDPIPAQSLNGLVTQHGIHDVLKEDENGERTQPNVSLSCCISQPIGSPQPAIVCSRRRLRFIQCSLFKHMCITNNPPRGMGNSTRTGKGADGLVEHETFLKRGPYVGKYRETIRSNFFITTLQRGGTSDTSLALHRLDFDSISKAKRFHSAYRRPIFQHLKMVCISSKSFDLITFRPSPQPAFKEGMGHPAFEYDVAEQYKRQKRRRTRRSWAISGAAAASSSSGGGGSVLMGEGGDWLRNMDSGLAVPFRFSAGVLIAPSFYPASFLLSSSKKPPLAFVVLIPSPFSSNFPFHTLLSHHFSSFPS
ncbi:uncharacterized protein BDR25DRAFT_362930 [Lindgomyces ingoldianus]|uniref:Uncharacterized protein n=1 Tax=Lindgomyces ingoldianus TaxID=673940 RepID=A0ACB6QB59_9PLEO|nr:uncharacterized protein BDR25DRAFT_362930 [Lindgomyces ingoldianus]KAF2463386.1 hypothetical protein BDR25DRAFT_362930 [Lindgomyces ingoldianus]